MKTEIEKLEKGKKKLTITIEETRVEKAFKEALEQFRKNVEIEGFRKGEAPLSKVEQKIDPGKLHGQVINILVPEAYAKAIQEEDLKPAANPRVEIKKFARGNELVFEAVICEVPEIELGNWKKTLQQLVNKPEVETAATLKEAESKATEKSKGKEEHHKHSAQDLLEAIRKEAKLELPDMLVEDEVNRMMSRLFDRLEALGMTPEQYLDSKNQSREDLRQEYQNLAEETLKNEFILNKLSKELDIKVSDEEIDQAIEATPDEDAREKMNTKANRIYIQTIIKKNKTIEKLHEIAHGNN